VGWFGGVRGREREDTKHALRRAQGGIYVHYFKDIRQGFYGRDARGSKNLVKIMPHADFGNRPDSFPGPA